MCIGNTDMLFPSLENTFFFHLCIIQVAYVRACLQLWVGRVQYFLSCDCLDCAWRTPAPVQRLLLPPQEFRLVTRLYSLGLIQKNWFLFCSAGSAFLEDSEVASRLRGKAGLDHRQCLAGVPGQRGRRVCHLLALYQLRCLPCISSWIYYAINWNPIGRYSSWNSRLIDYFYNRLLLYALPAEILAVCI